ncbi:MAG: hypothetical protein EBS22_10945 [Acidimicrobiia bacterium]|nr:hypothetical protein [Acidimicrobiia bacterium]
MGGDGYRSLKSGIRRILEGVRVRLTIWHRFTVQDRRSTTNVRLNIRGDGWDSDLKVQYFSKVLGDQLLVLGVNRCHLSYDPEVIRRCRP